MNIDNLFKDFKTVLTDHAGVLTEDNIRYYLFAKMYDQNCALHNYTLEFPYQRMAGNTGPFAGMNISSLSKSNGIAGQKELDMYYNDGNICLCIEIKFHRKGVRTAATAHPDAAGSMFNDMKRLNMIPSRTAKGVNVRKLFLYVTDDDMDSYLSNRNNSNLNKTYRNELSRFYSLQSGIPTRIDFTNKTNPETFLESSSKSFGVVSTPVLDISLLKSTSFVSPSSDIMSKTNCGRICTIKLFEIH